MNNANWLTAQNLKRMLREGKTYLEISNSAKTGDTKIDRTKVIIENFIKEVSVSEIYHHILDMEPADQDDYNKIMASLMKRFNGEWLTAKITIPEKTIEKFHEDYVEEEKSTNGLWLIAFCITIAFAIWCVFNYKKLFP